MPDEIKKIGEEYQRLGTEGFDAVIRSWGEVNRGFQALTGEMADYSKRAFDDGIHAWEQLVGVRSVEQAIEIQSKYAKSAFDGYVAEMSKLGKMCATIARNASEPVQQAIGRKVS